MSTAVAFIIGIACVMIFGPQWGMLFALLIIIIITISNLFPQPKSSQQLWEEQAEEQRSQRELGAFGNKCHEMAAKLTPEEYDEWLQQTLLSELIEQRSRR